MWGEKREFRRPNIQLMKVVKREKDERNNITEYFIPKLHKISFLTERVT